MIKINRIEEKKRNCYQIKMEKKKKGKNEQIKCKQIKNVKLIYF